ncbi:MAG: undecaprenyl-diphosphate phosphatase [Clostridiaceae bacterium]|nr:undecaprenyl-diphosphate phosphatase [Eubacteriales bacterium]
MILSVWYAMLLGLVQGLTEFLPVSSSGHLVLMQKLLGMDTQGSLFFDTMLHLGTLAAVFAVFYKEIWAMLRHPLQKKVGLLLAATAVTVALTLLFRKPIEASFGGATLGLEFLITAAILFFTEKLAHGKKTIEKMTYPQAAGVGLLQAVSILPAVSRSGATIAGSRFFGLKKKDAAEFSFLLSIPAILGSVVLQLPGVIETGLKNEPWPAILLGMLVAAVSGYFAVRLMLRIIVKKSLLGFAWYVAALGALVILDQLVFHVFFASPF